MVTPPLLWVAAGIVFGFIVGFFLSKSRARALYKLEKAESKDEASRILNRAQEDAENTRKRGELAGREEVVKLREGWEKEEARRREEVERSERRLEERSDALSKKSEGFNFREIELKKRHAEIEQRNDELSRKDVEIRKTASEIVERLEEVAGLSSEEAKKELVEALKDEARAEAANALREIREEAHRDSEREAQKILTLSIQRMAADVTADTTVSVVQLPSDEMKGRIIGREGRNIRSFEQATGVDVIIDDTPEAVVLSAFDPVRREVARIALQRLVEDGRIHPGRIEEIVSKAAKDIDQEMLDAAEEAVYDLGIHGVHPEIMRTVGRLRFRTSYGQNQLRHSKEVAQLAGKMASEIGLDVQTTKRAGLLHDVGKGMTHEHEGTHVELGYRLCKKHGEAPIVLNAIKAHHDEEPHHFPETFLVSAADAISGSRPGARREMFEGYVKRLEKLEEIAMEQQGVERCFAIQAGRELRVMVEPDQVDDDQMDKISEAVARRIESELQYPGQIKVVVIRETRSFNLAK